MIGLTVIGIILKQPVEYSAPTNVQINENTLSFDSVEGASKYRVIVKDIHGNLIFEFSTKYTTYDLKEIPSLKEGITYYIYLQTEATELMEASDLTKAVVYTKK